MRDRYVMERGWEDALERVPEHLRFGLLRYLDTGLQPGAFLCAVISNDLHAAVSLADPAAFAGLRELTSFLYNYCPSPCWGSKAALDGWRGLKGAS